MAAAAAAAVAVFAGLRYGTCRAQTPDTSCCCRPEPVRRRRKSRDLGGWVWVEVVPRCAYSRLCRLRCRRTTRCSCRATSRCPVVCRSRQRVCVYRRKPNRKYRGCRYWPGPAAGSRRRLSRQLIGMDKSVAADRNIYRATRDAVILWRRISKLLFDDVVIIIDLRRTGRRHICIHHSRTIVATSPHLTDELQNRTRQLRVRNNNDHKQQPVINCMTV